MLIDSNNNNNKMDFSYKNENSQFGPGRPRSKFARRQNFLAQTNETDEKFNNKNQIANEMFFSSASMGTNSTSPLVQMDTLNEKNNQLQNSMVNEANSNQKHQSFTFISTNPMDSNQLNKDGSNITNSKTGKFCKKIVLIEKFI